MSQNYRHSFSAIALSFCLFFFAQFSHAATVGNNASAVIDWSSISFGFLSGGGTTTNQSSNTFVSIFDEIGTLDSDSDSNMDWLTLTESSINYTDLSITTGIATATASTAELSAVTEFEANNISGISSEATRSATISGSGNGILLITATYDLLAEVTDTLLYSAAAAVGFEVTINGVSTNAFFDALSEVFTNGSSGPSSVSDSGTIALAVAFDDGDVIEFSAFAESDVISNPVPLPPAAWLFGAALMALFTVRRTK